MCYEIFEILKNQFLISLIKLRLFNIKYSRKHGHDARVCDKSLMQSALLDD